MPYLLVQEPAIVERRRSRPAGSTAGSMNRIDNSAFQRNTGCTTRGRGWGVGAGAGAPVNAI